MRRNSSKKSRKTTNDNAPNGDSDGEDKNAQTELVDNKKQQQHLLSNKNGHQAMQIKPSSLNLLSHPSHSFIDELELSENAKKLKLLDSTENTVGLIESNGGSDTQNSKTRQLISLTSQLKRAKMFSETNLNMQQQPHALQSLQQQQQKEMNVSSDGTTTDDVNSNTSVVIKRERRDSGVGGSLTREIE